MGFWYDYNDSPTFSYTPTFMGTAAAEESLFAEEYAAATLIDGGCDVIGHQADNQRISRYVERHTTEGTLRDGNDDPRAVWTIANDNQYGWRDYATQEALTTALGAVYWNWTSLYTRQLDQIHRHVWQADDVMDVLIEDHATSTVGFEQNTLPSIGIDEMMVRGFLNQQAQGSYQDIFEGPYDTTGQREDPVEDGETLSEEEWRTMCWFVEGVVEKSDPSDPSSDDQPAQVPTTDYQPADVDEVHPNTAPEILISVPGAPRGIAWQCDQNQ